MITVNLWDEAFRHNPGSSVHGKTAKEIRYVRDRAEWDGITIFTDDYLKQPGIIQRVKSRWKVGWLMEPREYKPENYAVAELALDRLDLLLTHDQALIDAYPEKVRFVPFGGCWIPRENWGLWERIQTPKRSLACQILSGKNFMPGHRLRHEILEAGLVASFGSGSGMHLSYKERAGILSATSFCIVVENSRARNFFTEKLLDCFALGTVPIYWGAQNISDFFDMRGIIPFESIEDLPAILASLNYESHMEGIKANLELMKPYEITDDYLAVNILQEILK